jgi:hypothetical protein
MFFRKKQKRDDGASREKLSYLCEKTVSYVVSRRRNDEAVIGKNGYINLAEGRIIICCEGKIIFDKPLDELSVGELMSKNGATFTYTGDDGVKTTVIAYYSYYRK